MKKLLLFLFIIQNFLFAQSPSLIKLTEKEGLPDIDFYNIIEDSQGFIWLAANKGLYRYNGKNYKYYSHKNQKGNAVFGTFEDSHGYVWCNNVSGQFFRVKDKSFELFIDISDRLNGELTDFFVTKKELIVFSGRNIFKVDLKTKIIHKVYNEEFSLLGIPMSYSNNHYYTKKNYLIKTDGNFKVVDSVFTNIRNKYYIDKSISRKVGLVTNGRIFLCQFLQYNKNRIFLIDFNNESLKEIKVPNKIKNSIYNQITFIEDDIWFLTEEGIFVYTLKDKLIFKRRLLKSTFTTKVIIDSDNNYWITTKGDGVFVVPNINLMEFELSSDFKNLNTIGKVNDSILLLGTKKGHVIEFNLRANDYKILDASSKLKVLDVVKDQITKKHFIIKEDKVLLYDIITRKTSIVQFDNLMGSKHLSILNDSLLLSSTYKNAKLIKRDFSEEIKLVDKRSYTNFYSAKNKVAYISSIDGVFIFDNYFENQEICFNGNSIMAKHIVETNDGKIWAASFNKGLYEIDNNKVLRNYTTTDGLLSDKIGYIKAEGNNLWLSTENGLQLFDREKNAFKNLTRKKGLPSYRISDIEIVNNNILLASNIGLYGFDKTKVFKKQNDKEVYFTKIITNGKEKKLKPFYQLDYNENELEIHFNVNGFQSFTNTSYEYRIIETDSLWKKINNQVNSITFNSLSSGYKTFEVRNINFPQNTNQITFFIKKPLWKTWWFYLCCIVVAILFAIKFSSYRVKKVKKTQATLLNKEKLKKQLVTSELENLRSQMNPHFIFNALNSIQEYIVFNESDLASTYLIKFSRLIRIYLEHTQENEVTLEEEIEALKIYLELEKIRFEDILEYDIIIFNKLDLKSIKVPSLFIQPYIENALKHGLLHKTKDRKLNIEFSLVDLQNILQCTIIDNGVGVKESQKLNSFRNKSHKSFATGANQRRIDLLNRNRKHKITVNIDSDNSGTKVTINIPLLNI